MGTQNGAVVRNSGNLLWEKITNERGVWISARPQLPADAGKHGPCSFIVKLNSHMVDLGFDAASVSRLTTDNGTVMLPNFWSDGRGGHHLSGKLTFLGDTIADATSITLTIDPPGLTRRVFSWTLQ